IKSRLTGNRAALPESDEKGVGSIPTKMGARPAPPSSTYKTYQSGDGSFMLQVPDNWDGLTSDKVSLIFAPQDAYGQRGQTVYVSHGIFIGAMPVEQSNLESATEAFVQAQIQSNPDFKIARQPEAMSFGDRRGYATVVAGPSPVTGVMEVDVIYTTATSDG